MHTILYFSPTGNAAFLADQLAANLKTDQVLALEKTNPETLTKNDHLILIYSIHGFNAPRTVKGFLISQFVQ